MEFKGSLSAIAAENRVVVPADMPTAWLTATLDAFVGHTRALLDRLVEEEAVKVSEAVASYATLLNMMADTMAGLRAGTIKPARFRGLTPEATAYLRGQYAETATRVLTQLRMVHGVAVDDRDILVVDDETGAEVLATWVMAYRRLVAAGHRAILAGARLRAWENMSEPDEVVKPEDPMGAYRRMVEGRSGK